MLLSHNFLLFVFCGESEEYGITKKHYEPLKIPTIDNTLHPVSFHELAGNQYTFTGPSHKDRKLDGEVNVAIKQAMDRREDKRRNENEGFANQR